MPIVVPLKDVEYIGVMKTNKPVTILAVTTIGLLAAFVALLIIGASGEGWGN